MDSWITLPFKKPHQAGGGLWNLWDIQLNGFTFLSHKFKPLTRLVGWIWSIELALYRVVMIKATKSL